LKETGEEGVEITCLSAVSKLSNDFYRLGTSLVASELGVELSNKRADEMMSAIITHYRATVSYPMIAAASNLEQTTDNEGNPYSFSLRFFNMKHIDALREVAKYFPRHKSNGLLVLLANKHCW